MSIGIKFKILNKYGNYLKQILNNIDSSDYIWKISEDEVYTNDFKTNNGFLFPQDKETLTNKEFVSIISQDSYYTVFANIELYEKVNDDITINNYDDFLKSSCILILIIVDNEFVAVYSKNEHMLECVYNNAVENNFSDISYINKNDLKDAKFIV